MSWPKLGLPLFVLFLGCAHSDEFAWSPRLGTPDLTKINHGRWDKYVGQIVQVRGTVEHYKRGPVVGGVYIDGIDRWPDGPAKVVVTGNLVRHDDRRLAENGAQAITAIYYSLTNAEWSLDN